VLSCHDSNAAPQIVQTALTVCGTKNFASVRLYSAPHLHRTIVAIVETPRGLAIIDGAQAWALGNAKLAEYVAIP
jgi:hypothetical protein